MKVFVVTKEVDNTIVDVFDKENLANRFCKDTGHGYSEVAQISQGVKIKITKCSQPQFWYKNAVNHTLECSEFSEDGDALLLPSICDLYDQTHQGAAGYVFSGDFVIVYEDNVQPQS